MEEMLLVSRGSHIRVDESGLDSAIEAGVEVDNAQLPGQPAHDPVCHRRGLSHVRTDPGCGSSGAAASY